MTKAELLFGLAKRPEAERLRASTEELLKRLEVLAWGDDAASTYATLRASQERVGKSLAALDLLIAAHAISLSAILVTADRAFGQIPGLTVENWRAP